MDGPLKFSPAEDLLLPNSAERVPNLKPILLRAIIERVLRSFDSMLAEQRITTTVDVPLDVCLTADKAMASSAVAGLVRNAIQSMANGGELVLTAVAGEREVELEIGDSGPRLEDRVECNDATVAKSDLPVTLRWAMAEKVAVAHGGWITALNCPEGGAAFTLHFSVPQSARAAA